MPQNNNIQEVPADDLPENLVPEDDLPKAGKDAKLADLENYQYEQIPEALGYLGGGLGLGYGLAEEGVKGTRNVVKWAERAMAGRQPIVGQFNPNITNAPSAPPMTPGQRYGQAMHGGTFTTSPDMGDIYAAGREATDFRRANPMWDVKEGTGLAVPKPSFEQQRAELAAQKTPMARAKQIGTNVLESTPARAAGLAGRIVAPAYGGYQLGYQGTQAYNRLANPQGAGDIAAGVANIGGAGLGAYTMVPSRPVRVGKVTVPSRVPAAIGSYLLGTGADALANDRNREQKSVLEKAAGGAIQGYANKGKVEIVEGGLSALKKAFTPRETKEVKLSEGLAPYINQRFNVTQADRMKVGDGAKGGVGFPGLQQTDPVHFERRAAWMTDSPGAATILAKAAKQNEGKNVFSTVMGSPEQHRSNRQVFGELQDAYFKALDKGLITPDWVDKTNQIIKKATVGKEKQPLFTIPFDVRDKYAFNELVDTFDKRGAIAKAFAGEGTGGKKGMLPNYTEIVESYSDPYVKNAPTYSIGNRLFTLTGEVEHAPDLHPAYQHLLKGDDLGVRFAPVPQEIALPDFYSNFVKEKGRKPSHFDYTRGYPRNQMVTEDYLNFLQKEGFAEGGGVDGYADGKKVVKSALGFFKPSAKSHSQDPEVAKALEDYLKGNISQQQRIDIVNQRLPLRPWTEMPPAYTDEQIKMALMENKRPKALVDVPAGMRVGNRLDIPAYTQHGVYVDTTHNLAGSNSPISYNRTGHLKDVEFSSKPNQAVRVGLGTKEQALTPMGVEMGAAKSPFAMIKGTNIGTKDEEVRRMMAEYLNDPDWAQIGMDPRRHSQFYDKATGMPVWSAEEKLQSGPLVLVPRRGLEVTSWDDPRLNLTDFPDKKYAGGGLACLKEGGKTPAWQRKEGKNPNGGLNAKGRASYNRETGGNLKRPQPEGGKRRDSFCARMKGMKKKLTSAETANDPDSRINKSLRAWNC